MLKKYPQYRKYDKTKEIFKILLKKLNMIKSIKIDGRYLFRLLFVLDDMNFPHIIIIKYSNYALNQYYDSNTIAAEKINRKIDALDSLRTYLLLL